MLPLSFYRRKDVAVIARELLGKALFTCIDGKKTGGIITETEAYRGVEDKACHAYKGRRTARTEVMFHNGGVAYVYLCYGVHYLLNVVTHGPDVPHAVLIRALYPLEGEKWMALRRGKAAGDPTLTRGPGALTQALGITGACNGRPFNSESLWIEDRGLQISDVSLTPRIGVDYAEEDALLPLRFLALQIPRQNRYN